MNEQNIQNEQLYIIDGQLLGCILYILSLILSITIILDQRQRALNKESFLTTEEATRLALFNKIVILLLIIWFLYLNYKAKELSQTTNQNTNTIDLQIISSFISIIPALIGIYVVATSFSSSSFQTADIENPYI